MEEKIIKSDLGDNYITFQKGSPLIVFLSGWDSFNTYQTFKPVIDRLPSSFGIFTIDYLDSGRSGQAQRNYKLEEQAKVIIEGIRSLNAEKIVIVAHSIGGPVALNIMHELDNVVGFVGIEPTTFEVMNDAQQSDDYQKMLHRYDQKSAEEMETMIHQRLVNSFSKELAQSIWKTANSDNQKVYDCVDLSDSIVNNLSFMMDQNTKGIIFTEPFRKDEYERSEYATKHTEVISLGDFHYLHWEYPKEVAQAIVKVSE